MTKISPLLIRADAFESIGTDHILRMLALGHAYKCRGGEVHFATASCSEELVASIVSLGISHYALVEAIEDTSRFIEETLMLAHDIGAEWIACDGPHFANEFQREVASSDFKLFCVDSGGGCNQWQCDALLNSRITSESEINTSQSAHRPQLLLGQSFELAELTEFTNISTERSGADRAAAFLAGSLRVSVITANDGWVKPLLSDWLEKIAKLGHTVSLCTTPEDIPEGDVLLILSYWGLIGNEFLAKNSHNLVAHGSDLPDGKGWSPMTWQILEGKSFIPITLFEATDKVDAGDIYLKGGINLNGAELIDDLRYQLIHGTLSLCETFIGNYPMVVTTKKKQPEGGTFYARRTSEDSQLNIHKSIAEQFNLLRVVDNESYPAFFEMHNRRYTLKIERLNQNE